MLQSIKLSTPIKVVKSTRSESALKIQIGKTKTLQTMENETEVQKDKKNQKLPNLKRQSSTNAVETIAYQGVFRKKINLSNFVTDSFKTLQRFRPGQVLKSLRDNKEEFFQIDKKSNASLRNEFYNSQKKTQVVFPTLDLPKLYIRSNDLLTRTIEIMSNQNQKIIIPIHEGLYKSNTSHKSQFEDGNINQIPNLCDFKMKNEYSESIEFIKQYKSGYTPIQMQKRNHQDLDYQKKQLSESTSKNPTKDKTKNHFIRKQQSTLTLPRTCGVSYIKQSESLLTQKKPFEPLPPIIFQGSTSCFISSNGQKITSLDHNSKQMIQRFIISLENCWLPFIISNQDQMRDILLGTKTKNAKVGFVEGIQNLWPLYVEGTFILILIGPQKLETQEQVWEAFQSKLTYFKIGILSKKSTSGKKAFLKSIKAEPNDTSSLLSLETHQCELSDEFGSKHDRVKMFSQTQRSITISSKDISEEQKKINSTFQFFEHELKDCKNVITMSLRLEMYVEEIDWKKNFTKQNKDILNQIIMNLKESLQKKSIKVISQRLQLTKESRLNLFQQKFKFLRKPKISNNSAKQFTQFKISTKFPSMQNLLDNQNGILSFSYTNKEIFFANSAASSVFEFLSHISTEDSWKKAMKFPIYYISTRDSFAFDLIEKKTILKRQNGRYYTKIDYYFYPDNVPTNFGLEYRKLFPNLDVGVTAYHDFFTEVQMKKFEQNTFSLEKKAFKNKFLQMTVQPSIVATKIKRTKFFFGYRYMWTRCQLSEPCSYVGAGVRKDVASRPAWAKSIQDEMVKQNIVQKDFINSIAINVYHDGKEGLAQHFDDAVRFKQPIYTLRLFSDARLSFGSQFYGFCNGAFIIPLPRGCILVMQENSYAANGVKHCVRPYDMTGKSAAVILRQMHSQVVSEASKYDELIDFPAWLSCLSSSENSVTFSEQKRLEAENIMKSKQ